MGMYGEGEVGVVKRWRETRESKEDEEEKGKEQGEEESQKVRIRKISLKVMRKKIGEIGTTATNGEMCEQNKSKEMVLDRGKLKNG